MQRRAFAMPSDQRTNSRNGYRRTGLLIFSQRHLAAILKIYEAHFNNHRPHRALAQRSPAPPPQAITTSDNATIRRTRLLGGLINEYRNAA